MSASAVSKTRPVITSLIQTEFSTTWCSRLLILFIHSPPSAAAAAALLRWRRPNGSQHSHPRGASPLRRFGPGRPVSLHIKTATRHACLENIRHLKVNRSSKRCFWGLMVLQSDAFQVREISQLGEMTEISVAVFQNVSVFSFLLLFVLGLSVLPKWPECSASGLVPQMKCRRPAPLRTLTWDSWRHKEVLHYCSLLTHSTSIC